MLEINIKRLLRDSRLCRAVLGVDGFELKRLELLFSPSWQQACHARKRDRQRALGGGQKGALPQTLSKLVFILLYLKAYPTFDLLGFFFGIDRSQACRWVHKLLPVLEGALGRACVLPARKISSMEEFFRAFPGARDIFIDGTERPKQKPKNLKQRRKTYSGKKKQTTRKAIVICDEQRRIGYLSPSKSGRRHDKKLLDKSGIVPHIPADVTVWADTGFQGLARQHPNTVMPRKASKKSPLTNEQKQNNRVISSIRVLVEHALSGIKRLACMSGVYRNRKENVDDKFALLSSGIWNLHLQTA